MWPFRRYDWGVEIENWSCDRDHALLKGWFVIRKLVSLKIEIHKIHEIHEILDFDV